MDLQEYSQALNGHIGSDGFAAMNPQQQQESIAGVRNWYLQQNPEARVEDVDTITEGTNKGYLRATGQGRALPIVDINLPNKQPGFEELSKEEKLKKIEEYKLKVPSIAATAPTQKEDAEYFINQSVRELERQVNGQDTGYLADKGKRLLEGFASGLASGVGAESAAQGIQDYFHENTKYDEDFSAQLAQGLGSAGSSVLIIAGAAAASGGLGATAATAEAIGVGASLASNGIMRYNEAYTKAIKNGVSDSDAHDLGVSAMPAAVIDALSDKILASKLMPAKVNKVFATGSNAAKAEMFKEITKNASLRGKLTNWAEAAITEGLSEAGGDYAAGLGPYLLSGDKSYLPTAKESLNSFAIGAIIGGGLAGAVDLPDLVGNKQGTPVTTVNANGETVEVTPQYSTKSERDVAETEKMIPSLRANESSEVFQLLAEGKYKEARALSDEYLAQAAAPTPAATPAATPAGTTANVPAATGAAAGTAAATTTGATVPAVSGATATAGTSATGAAVNPAATTGTAPAATAAVNPAATPVATTAAPVINLNETHKVITHQALNDAKPKLGNKFGNPDMDFASDFDKLAYLIGGKSKSAPAYQALAQSLGLDVNQLIEHGQKIKAAMQGVTPAIAGGRLAVQVPAVPFAPTTAKPKSQTAQNAVEASDNANEKLNQTSRKYPEASTVSATATPNETQTTTQGQVGQAGGIPAVEVQPAVVGAAVQTQTGTAPTQSQGAEKVANIEARKEEIRRRSKEIEDDFNARKPSKDQTPEEKARYKAYPQELKDLAQELRDIIAGTTTPVATEATPAPVANTASAPAIKGTHSVYEFMSAMMPTMPSNKVRGFVKLMADVRMKNPNLRFTFERGDYPIGADGLYDGDKNLIYISKRDYRTISHETAHALTQWDIKEYAGFAPGEFYAVQLRGVLADSSTPKHIKTLIDVYFKAAEELKHTAHIGVEINEGNFEFYGKNQEAYSFVSLDEFVAEAMSMESFQEKLASIMYNGKTLWQHIVDTISDAMGWMKDIAQNNDPELLARSNNNNILVATLAAAHQIIQSDIREPMTAAANAKAAADAAATVATAVPTGSPTATVAVTDIANTPEETAQVVAEVAKETEQLDTLPDDAPIEQVTQTAPHSVATATDAAVLIGDENKFKLWLSNNFKSLVRFGDLIWKTARNIILSHVGFGQFDATTTENISNNDIVALHQTVNKDTLDPNLPTEELPAIPAEEIQQNYNDELNNIEGYDSNKVITFSMDTGEVSMSELDQSISQVKPAATPATTTPAAPTVEAQISPVEKTTEEINKGASGNDAVVLSPETSTYWLGQGDNKAVTALSQLIGQNEKKSPGIKQMITSTGSNQSPDTFAWCATAISWALNKGGIKSSIQSARQFLSAGKKTTSPKYGDVVVMWNDNEETGGKNGYGGHVSFYLGEVGDNVITISGNIHDSVLVASFPKARVLGYRSLAGHEKSNINYLPGTDQAGQKSNINYLPKFQDFKNKLMSATAALSLTGSAVAPNASPNETLDSKYPVVAMPAEFDEYFKANPGVTGMMIGAGNNDTLESDPRQVILNPYSDLNPAQKEALILNERIRHFIQETNPALDFEVTQAQIDFFKGEAYSKPEYRRQLKETIVARILTGDESAGETTPEQRAAASEVAKGFMDLAGEKEKSNINYLPAQTRAQKLLNGFRQFFDIRKGKITDKIDTPTQKILSLLKDIKASDIFRLSNETQDHFFELVDNIYQARKAAVQNPAMRIDSDEMIEKILAVSEAINAERIKDMIADYDGLIEFDKLGINLNDRKAVQAVINKYMEDNNTADLVKRQNRSAAAKARVEEMYQKYRDVYEEIRTQVKDRFADRENYIKEMEATHGGDLSNNQSLRTFLGHHFDYLTNLDVSVLESKDLYQHFFAINNMLDGNFKNMDLTAKQIGKLKDSKQNLKSITGLFRDPVSDKNVFIRTLSWLNQKAELHQVQLQRITGFETARKFIQDQLLGDFYRGLVIDAENQKKQYTNEYIAFRDKLLGGKESTAEDKIVCAIMGRLVQRGVDEDPDGALLKNIRKEYQSLNNRINGAATNDMRKHFSFVVKPLLDQITKGIEDHGEGAMIHFMDTFAERARGKGTIKQGDIRRQLVDKTQEIFSRYTLASRILAEGFHGRTFNEQVSYIPNDVVSTRIGNPDKQDMTNQLIPEGFTQSRGLTEEEFHYKERQTDLGEEGAYSYNNESLLKRNVERMSVDHMTLPERFVIKSRLAKGGELNKIITQTKDNTFHQQRVDHIESLVCQVLKNATSAGVPQNALVETLSKATRIYSRGTLSSMHHIITQPIATVADYALRTGDLKGWMDAAVYYAANYAKVNKWLADNSRWTGDREALDVASLDNRRTPIDESEVAKMPFVKWMGNFYEKAGDIMTLSLRLGDNFSAKTTLLAEYNRLRKEKGYRYADIGSIDFDVTEGNLLAQATLNSERISNTSNKAFRSDLFSDRDMSTTTIRNMLFAFSSHSANLATQMNMACRDLIDMRGIDAPPGERAAKVRTIGAIMAQQLFFTSARFAIGAMTGRAIIELAQNLFDDDDGKIQELETKVQIARKQKNKIKIAYAENELANAKTVRSMITKMEDNISTDAWFKSVIRDASQSVWLGFNNQTMQNITFFVPDAFARSMAQEGQKKMEAKIASDIKIAKEKKDMKQVARLTEQQTVIGASEYIPFAYSNSQGFGAPGIYGSVLDSYYRQLAEAQGFFLGTKEWNYTDFISAASTAGLGQSEITKAMNHIDTIEDATWKRNQEFENEKLPAAKEAQKHPKSSFNFAGF